MSKKMIGRCFAGMASAANGVKTSVGNCKKDGEIVDYERKIATLTSEIGQLTVKRLDGGDDVEAPIKERYSEILKTRAAMAQAAREKKTSYVICPHCGGKTSAGMAYCGLCGEKIEAVS